MMTEAVKEVWIAESYHGGYCCGCSFGKNREVWKPDCSKENKRHNK